MSIIKGNIIEVTIEGHSINNEQGVIVDINNNNYYIHLFNKTTGEDLNNLLPTKTGAILKKGQFKLIHQNPTQTNYILDCDSKLMVVSCDEKLLEHIINKLLQTNIRKITVYSAIKQKIYKKIITLK